MATQRATTGWLLVGLGALLALGLAACTSTTPTSPASGGTQPSGGATQTSEGGQVTVAVTWQGPSAATAFTVAMDTHAIDLDAYDLAQLATLRTDQGREVRPVGWDAPKGGHHRSGTLTFPATAADGSPLLAPGTRAIELVIRDVADVPQRRFQWPV